MVVVSLAEDSRFRKVCPVGVYNLDLTEKNMVEKVRI